jgi:hypothetical protein
MKNEHTPTRNVDTGRSLNRYIKRFFIPTFVAGFAALILFLLFARNDYRSAEPDVAPSDYVTRGSDSMLSRSDRPETLTYTQAVFTSLDPQMLVLSKKIEALEEAGPKSWPNRRDEVVHAWETFDVTYKAISDGLPNRK